MTSWDVFIASVSVEFGDRLRRRREELGIRQADLAARLNLKRTSITNMEAGHQVPSLPQVIALAQALRLKPADLIPDIQAPISDGDEKNDRAKQYSAFIAEALENGRRAS
jgi:transcriptional regulator with XRE-family HTH domain